MEEGSLTLGMLSEDDSLQEDFILGSAEEALGKDLDNPPIKKEGEKEKDISEEIGKTSPEIVAEKDKDTPDAKPSPGSDNKMSQIYSSLATHLNETGVLPSLNLKENKVENVEQFQEAIKKEIDNGVDENIKAYNKAMSQGEPENAYVKYTKQKEQLDAITDESLSDVDSAQLRFNIIAQDFLNKEFSKDDAMKHARRSQDLGEDITDSKQALERIKSFNSSTYQKSVQEKKDLETENTNKITSFVKGTDEIIRGIKLTEGTKDELLKQMTTAVGRDKEGKPLTKYGEALTKDPVKTKAITEYMFLLTKGFTDFSKMTNIITSKATSNIDDILRSTGGDFLNSGKVNFDNNDSNSSFSIGDEFEFDI